VCFIRDCSLSHGSFEGVSGELIREVYGSFARASTRSVDYQPFCRDFDFNTISEDSAQPQVTFQVFPSIRLRIVVEIYIYIYRAPYAKVKGQFGKHVNKHVGSATLSLCGRGPVQITSTLFPCSRFDRQSYKMEGDPIPIFSSTCCGDPYRILCYG